MASWMVKGLVLRAQLIEARDDANTAQLNMLPNLKKNDLRSSMGQLRRRVEKIQEMIKPREKVEAEVDYSREWSRLAGASSVIVNKEEKK